MDENENNISQFSLNSVDESFFYHSTPHKAPQPSPSRRKTFTSKKSHTFAAPAPVKLYQCPQCPKKKPYKTLRYFNQHMLQHKVEGMFCLYYSFADCYKFVVILCCYFPDICSKLPNLEELLRKSPEICDRALTQMSSVLCFGVSGKKFKDLVQLVTEAKDGDGWALFCQNVIEIFSSAIEVKKFILPTALWTSIFKAQESLLSSESLRESLETSLKAATNNSDSRTLQLFVCEFVLITSEEVLTFIRQSIVPPQQKALIRPFDKEDRETIHFVGGFVVFAFVKKAKQFPKNKDWQEILIVLKSRAIEGFGVEPASDSDKEWTKDQNRGGLTIIGAKCMDFFLSVAAAATKVGKTNGILLHEKLIEEIYSPSSYVPLKWDALVGFDCSLSEKVSLQYMNALAKSFSRTWGNGLRSKVINEMNEKPFASVNLRHTVAPKKK